MHCILYMILYEEQVHIVCFVKSRHVADVHKYDMPEQRCHWVHRLNGVLPELNMDCARNQTE